MSDSNIYSDYDIFKSNWIDVPYANVFHAQGYGFSNYPGIYLCLAGSNSSYGNNKGGFRSEKEALKFVADNNLNGNWKVTVRK